MRDAEQAFHGFAQVVEAQWAIGRLRRDPQGNHRSEAGAINLPHAAQVEDDRFSFGQERLNLLLEAFRRARDQPTGTD